VSGEPKESSRVFDQAAGRAAAIYARVSSERQRVEQTIQSQTAGLRDLAAARGLVVVDDLVFEDEGFSGATLTRPALERLRDRAADGSFDVLLCHAPDRLARRYAYQVLLLEELARAGIEVIFAKEPERSGTPEDELLRQFQGMIAEYERAQIAERTRRGKAHRAHQGSQAVLSGAPFGYRYIKKTEHCDAYYEIDEAPSAGRASDLRPLHAGRRVDRSDRSVADRTADRDPDRQGSLGPLDGLGDAQEPGLPGARRVRQDRQQRPARQAHTHDAPARRAPRPPHHAHRPPQRAVDHDRGPGDRR